MTAQVTVKKNDNNVSFFCFPGGKSYDQITRRNFWIEFCKRSGFTPTHSTRICSRHFSEDAYDPAHSPSFLKSIGCKESFNLRLKNDALPSLNKPKLSCEIPTKKRRLHSERRQRTRVSKKLYLISCFAPNFTSYIK